MEEIFKVITGLENYEVSNLGNIRNIKTKRILKPGMDMQGYYKIDMQCAGNRITKKIHRLVAETFLENLDDKQCVDHIDNNRLNNNLSNLRFATHKENAQNRKLSSRNKSGSKGVLLYNKKWRASIMIDGISIYLGGYENIEDAIQARITRANQLFGVFINACEKV